MCVIIYELLTLDSLQSEKEKDDVCILISIGTRTFV